MFCPNCARPNPDSLAVCLACGAPLPRIGVFPGPAILPTQTSGMAVAGFVLAFLFPILGLIFSILGYRECRRGGGQVGGEGLALAGIILSSIFLVIALMMMVMLMSFMTSLSGGW
jgi:hypothetical protein